MIDGQVWWFFVGRRLGIDIWDPTGKRHNTDASKVTGRSWEVIEKGQLKKTSDGKITPSDVRSWIQKTLKA